MQTWAQGVKTQELYNFAAAAKPCTPHPTMGVQLEVNFCIHGPAKDINFCLGLE